MGSSSSKPAAYPLPIPGQPSYGASQSSWSVIGNNKKGRGRSNSDGYFLAMPNPTGYAYPVQPYPYYATQGYSSSYYPQAGGIPPAVPMPQPQPNVQMPAPNTAPAQQGPAYDPAGIPPPPVAMPAPPRGGPVIPPASEPQPQPQQQQPQPQQQQQQQQQQRQQQQQQAPVIPPARNEYIDADGRPNPSVYGPPGPRPRTPLKNPLPTPPRDLYEISPYRSLIRDLPGTTSILSKEYNTVPAQSELRRHGGLGSLLGSRSKGDKKSRKGGLFRSSSTARRDDVLPSLSGLYGGPLQRSATFTGVPPLTAVYPQNGSATTGNGMPASNSAPAALSTAADAATGAATAPDPSRPPPVRFDHRTPLAGFMNHSPHRILHQNKVYPSALHLLEALKFIGHRPDLAERVRAVKDVKDVYSVSAAMHDFVRKDWGNVLLQMVEEVLYLKFKQHPDLRSLLMNTGGADVIYSQANDPYWGEGPVGQGANELGKAIMRVRERLRKEGYSGGPPASAGTGPP